MKGEYLSACEVQEAGDFALGGGGLEAEEKIWEETLEILDKADPELQQVLRGCGLQSD